MLKIPVRLAFLVAIAYTDTLGFNGIAFELNACIVQHDELELELYHGDLLEGL